MKVLLCPGDSAGCGLYRMHLPGDALADELEIAYAKQIDAELTVTKPTRVVSIPPLDADVVVIQRPLARLVADCIPHLQAQGIAVVVELDDDLGRLHPLHIMAPALNPKRMPEQHAGHLARACREADLVTCTTPALAARYAPHGRAVVLPNYVPASYLDVAGVRDGRTLGWTGFVQTHPTDLQATGSGVVTALRDSSWRFHVVGDPEGVRRALSLPEEPSSTGYVSLGDYPAATARLDLGIVPLDDIPFNHAKSALKGLEYAALGVPFVASPLPEYERIAAVGLGTLAASKGRAWRRALRTLMDDEALRSEIAARGREIVREHFTIERNAWRWAEAWASCLRRAVV